MSSDYDRLLSCLKRDLYGDRGLREVLAGKTKESQYLVVNGSGLTVRLRDDTAANWTANDPVLAAGEIGLEIDQLRFKVGTGTTPWSELGYWIGGGHAHDDLYYTESEVDGLLAGKADSGHTHSTQPHNHNDTYYTEAEVDALLNQILYEKVGFYRIRGTGYQSISSGNWSAVNFDTNGTKGQDVGGYGDAFSSNPTNINMLEDGIYRIKGKVCYYNDSGSACNLLQVRFIVGGSEDNWSRFFRDNDPIPNGARVTANIEMIVEVVGSEYVYMQVYSNVGGSVYLFRSSLTVERLWTTPTIGGI